MPWSAMWDAGVEKGRLRGEVMRWSRSRRFFLDGRSGESAEMKVCGRDRFREDVMDKVEEMEVVDVTEEVESLRQWDGRK